MPGNDVMLVVQWWLGLVLVGGVGWIWTRKYFSQWETQGYLLGKAVGMVGMALGVWWLGSWKLLPFTQIGIVLVGLVTGLIGLLWTRKSGEELPPMNWKMVVVEEVFFLTALWFWSWIKAHEPNIHGLEKFMDFGFTKSILRTNFFPAMDMWFAGKPINYYYFGHLMMAMLTKISGIDLAVSFNLMLATLFGMCLTMSFAIGRQVLAGYGRGVRLLGAVLGAILVTVSGNLQTIYAFTTGYMGEDAPPPFWKIWSDLKSWGAIKEGFGAYWYPNATRFIPYTIHEFPGYSFVVSDLHGHVLGIPLALLLIAILVQMFGGQKKVELRDVVIYGILTGAAFMTNALDGPIYLVLFIVLMVAKQVNFQIRQLGRLWGKQPVKELAWQIGILLAAFMITVLPFVKSFEPFVSGVAVNCPPAFLAGKKFGPVLFEEVEKCQKSPLWMLVVLWGFFAYTGMRLLKIGQENSRYEYGNLFKVMSWCALGLILFPEFFYFKDIYPQHFRSNTMFKLGYQVFIWMSLISGYVVSVSFKNVKRNALYLMGLVPLLVLVLIYPYFAVKSYFEELKTYRGLDGLVWLEASHPDDYSAIKWLNANVSPSEQPVVLEANGDSYTDFNRVSAFTGLPTVAGWVVHEWLWRGGYDPISERGMEVKSIYEGSERAKQLIDKYQVRFIVVGEMEREKYPQLDEQAIKKMAAVVFRSGTTTVYKVN